ncbi:MAG: hypothetical protein QOE51_5102 [Actinoplanes sp.]|jgi:Meckel syndrome type 1 protein|nr:hypothetical protein [Actinoplanes sp.]
MSRLFRNRMTATLLGGLALGLPLPASEPADGVPLSDSSPVLITIMPPSPAAVAAPPADGPSPADLPGLREQSPVAVAAPPADGPSLADLSGLREQSPDPTTGSATIAGVPHLSSAPPALAPTITAHLTSPTQTSPTRTSPNRAVAGLTMPGTLRPSTPHRLSTASAAAAPSDPKIKTGTSRRTRAAVLPTADATQPVAGSGVPNRGGSSPPATSAVAVAVPTTRAAHPVPVAVPSRAATPRQAPAEPVAEFRPVASPEPIGLLALVASVCVVGVGFCAIRTLVSQRAYRSRIA